MAGPPSILEATPDRSALKLRLRSVSSLMHAPGFQQFIETVQLPLGSTLTLVRGGGTPAASAPRASVHTDLPLDPPIAVRPPPPSIRRMCTMPGCSRCECA